MKELLECEPGSQAAPVSGPAGRLPAVVAGWTCLSARCAQRPVCCLQAPLCQSCNRAGGTYLMSQQDSVSRVGEPGQPQPVHLLIQ